MKPAPFDYFFPQLWTKCATSTSTVMTPGFLPGAEPHPLKAFPLLHPSMVIDVDECTNSIISVRALWVV
jgi:hypothetical protein